MTLMRISRLIPMTLVLAVMPAVHPVAGGLTGSPGNERAVADERLQSPLVLEQDEEQKPLAGRYLIRVATEQRPRRRDENRDYTSATISIILAHRASRPALAIRRRAREW